jgi:hypothetical protein
VNVNNTLSFQSSGTYAEHFDFDRPYVWLPWCQKLLLFVNLLQSHSYTKCCVPLHVHLLGLEQLQLLERYVVSDPGWEPSIAHRGRVERNVCALSTLAKLSARFRFLCHTGASISRHVLQQLDNDVALGLLGRLRDAAYLLLRRPSIQTLSRNSSYT